MTGAASASHFGQPAVEHRDGLVADPAQHPPQARRHGAVAGVVAHDLVRRLQCRACPSQATKRFGSGSGWRPLRPVFGRRKVAVEMGEQRARNVRFAILLLAERGLGEIVAAIEDAPARQVRGELGGADEGRVQAVDGPMSASELAVQPLVEVHLGVFHRRLVGAGVVEALLVERAAAAVQALADLVVLDRGLDVRRLLRLDELALEERRSPRGSRTRPRWCVRLRRARDQRARPRARSDTTRT